MLISVKKRFVFIANSKTASTSIEAVLTPYAEINRVGSAQRKHISWCEAKKEYSFLFDQPTYAPDTFLKFGIIREPADWVRSWFNYRIGNSRVDHSLPTEMTFEEFWDSDDWIKRIRQKEKFEDESGKCCFDLIIPHNQLSILLPKIISLLGVKSDRIPRRNKSSGKLSCSEIPIELIEDINSHFKEDYDFFLEWEYKAERIIEKITFDSRSRIENSYGRAGLEVESFLTESNPWVQYASLDEFPPKIQVGQSFSIGGIVVLNENAPRDCFLCLKGGVGSKSVQWGLQSPWIAQQYPGYRNSRNARFRVDKLVCEENFDYKICLVDRKGEHKLLFQFTSAEK